MADTATRSLLLISHPGHELRLLGWIRRERPLVCILTDGSGSDATPRIDETLRILHGLQTPIGPIFGGMTDRDIYAAILAGEAAPIFEAITKQLVDVVLSERIDRLVSDGMEGYNPTHDLCHALGASIAEGARQRGRHVEHLCVPMLRDPRSFADGESPMKAQILLESDEHATKMTTIRAYAASSGPTLRQEVDQILREFGEEAFAHECLFDASAPAWPIWSARFTDSPPFYETYGRAQVAAGRYAFVISFNEHIRPLIERLLSRSMDDSA